MSSKINFVLVLCCFLLGIYFLLDSFRNSCRPIQPTKKVCNNYSTMGFLEKVTNHLDSLKEHKIELGFETNFMTIYGQNMDSFKMIGYTSDSLINSFIYDDTLYSSDDFEQLFVQKWCTAYKWAINTILYSKFQRDGSSLSRYEKFWTKQNQKEDSIYWTDFF